MKTILAYSFFSLCVCANMQAQNSIKEKSTELPAKITIPLVDNSSIKIDGIFPENEWKGALQFNMSENFEILFIADNDNLFIGLKYAGNVADYKQPLDCLSEVYFSTNGKEFYNLHSSARLAEGINKFSADLKQPKYSIEEVSGWEANFGSHVRENDLNCKGNEYKISLSKIKSRTLKMACGIMAVNFSYRESANFPVYYSYKNSENWVELILPYNTK